MLESHAFSVPYQEVIAESGELSSSWTPELESEAKTWADVRVEQMANSWVPGVRHFGKFLSWVKLEGEVQELASKMAAYKMLEERDVPKRERAYVVRKFAGTPDYSQAGFLTPIINTIFPYSRVMINALESTASLATKPKTRGGWALKMMTHAVIPAVIVEAMRQGLGIGLTDDDDDEEGTLKDIKDLMAKIPSYEFNRGPVIPLGQDSEGKAVYATLPMDENMRPFYAMARLMVQAAAEKDKSLFSSATFTETFGEFSDTVSPNMNPVLKIGAGWQSYLGGKNYIDSFTDRPAVPESVFKTRDSSWLSARMMIGWTAGQFGVASATSKPVINLLSGKENHEGEQSWTEHSMDWVPGIGAVVKVSDSGLDEKRWNELALQEAERETFRLSLPTKVRDTTRRHFLLTRTKDGDADQEELLILSKWRSKYYMPITERLKEGDLEPAQEKQLRDKLEKSLDSLDTKKPAIAYAGALAYDATANPGTKTFDKEKTLAALRLLKKKYSSPQQAAAAMQSYWIDRGYKIGTPAWNARVTRLRQVWYAKRKK